MPKAEDIRWFKQQFQSQIEAAVQGTPFTVDTLTAVACQETGYIWEVLRKKGLGVARILELCVGDTLDSSKGRRAFPQTKADLVARPNGERMFGIARQGLVDMARYVPGYSGAAANPNKFCHGFGIFQLDLQFFLKEPDYFLEKRYADFGVCVEKAVGELTAAARRIGFQDKTKLSDLEMAYVAIAYNTGGFKPSRGLKQGYFNGTKYYGEQFFDFLRLSKSVVVEGGEAAKPTLPPTTPGTAPLPEPTPVEPGGQVYEVDVRESPLRLRREPKVDAAKPDANVIARLPDGQHVQAVTNKKVNGFLEVETSLLGAHLRGFASAQFLKPASGVEAVAVVTPSPTPPAGNLVAVYMPRKSGTVTKRTDPATPHSLNEPGQPGRKGKTPDELRAELAAIVDWLAVDKPANRRYQPTNKSTFCNIYAHDFCHLAGVYLPRVWWSAGAIESLTQGQAVQPLLGKTIDEQRANDLFRWLRDFGIRFGWRQTGSPTKLQLEVNQGAVGLLVARRRADGLSGHLTVVVPETEENRARRDASGEVVAPLQSQAGTTNFRYGTGKTGWWLDEDRFAEHAFWLHG
jgi:hypothetical protein